MALQVQCQEGHIYMQSDIYVGLPQDAPMCPVCYLSWAKENDCEVTSHMVDEADKSLENTEKILERKERQLEQEKELASHRKEHRSMSSNFCPECGERLG